MHCTDVVHDANKKCMILAMKVVVINLSGSELQARQKLATHLGVALADLKLKSQHRQPAVRAASSYKGISFHKNLGRFVSNSGMGLRLLMRNLLSHEMLRWFQSIMISDS